MLNENPNIEHLQMILTELRIFLRKYFYTHEVIEEIKMRLFNTFELFSVDYIEDQCILQCKIKKTDMKKLNSFSHSSEFYYSYMTDILRNTYNNHTNEIHNLLLSHDQYVLLENSSLLSTSFVVMMYNILVINDNIINIVL